MNRIFLTAGTSSAVLPSATRKCRRFHLALLTCWLALATLPALAQVVPIDYYRMGEDDPANAGAASTTQDSAGSKLMTFVGAPFYSTDVAASASASVNSSRSMNFFSGGPYGSAALLSTATDNFGLEAWVKPTTLTGNHVIAYNGNSGSSGWGIIQIGNTYQALFGGVTYFGSAPAMNNTWTHVAVVRDSGIATLYVNGIAAGTTTSAPNVPAGAFAVAAAPPTLNTDQLAGFLDEVRAFTFVPGTFTPAQLLVNALVVTTTADAGAGSMRQALLSVAAGSTINVKATGTITLASELPPINANLTLNGNGIILNFAGAYPGLLVNTGVVALNELTIQNALAQGTAGNAGGGGGAGVGGGLIVGPTANLTLNKVYFLSNAAKGGAGGNGTNVGGGNTGASVSGGVGGSSRGGLNFTGNPGGTGGMQTPGSAGTFGGPGGSNFQGKGGGGGGGGTSGGSGGIAVDVQPGAGGAGGNPGPGAVGGEGAGGGGGSRGFGGGGGGRSPSKGGGSAGGGGFGGGGGGGGGSGAGGNSAGGAGDGGGAGFGAGGGGGGGGGSSGGRAGVHGNGQNGGGNGANGATGEVSGALAGGSGGGGGGGGGLGGAIFMFPNANLTIAGPGSISGNSVVAGAPGSGGSTAATAGSALGSAIFMPSNSCILTVRPGSGNTFTIADDVAGILSRGQLNLTDAGTLVLTGANTYGFGTNISAGTLLANTPSATGSATGTGAVTLTGGTLAGNGKAGGTVNLNAGNVSPGNQNGASSSLVGTLTTGALAWNGGATMSFQLGVNAAASDLLVLGGALNKAGSGPYQFNFSDGAAAPGACGTAYTLIQASGINGFVPGDFSYTYSGSSAFLTGSAGASPGSFSIVGNNLTFTTVLCTQAITNFAATPSSPTYSPNGTFALSASPGASAQPVTFASTTPGICSVTGSTVTMLAAGTCGLTANEIGNANYGAAPQLSLNVTIAKASQSISFDPAPVVVVGGTGTVIATATSGLATTTSTASTTCSVTPTGTVTGLNAGSCTIDAVQSGDTNYLAAPPASQTFNIGMGSQTIAFTGVPSVVVGGTGTVTATGGASNNAVTFSTTSSTCTVTPTGTVTGVNAGSCGITANQAGNTNYAAAASVTQTLTIGQASSTTALSTLCAGTFVESQPFTMSAAVSGASPTGSLTFVRPGNVVLCGNVPLISGSGSCTTSDLPVIGTDTQDMYDLTASYNGDTNNASSVSATISVTVLSATDVVFRNGLETASPSCPIE